ncbi:MAG: transposase, partial [Prochlorococcaceae cyanobacterium]
LEPEGLDPQPADAMPHRGLAHRADGSPTAAAQRNYTDPDSHIMKSDGNLLQGYSCQAAVDGDHQVIVAMGVSNQPPDPEHLVPMLERTMANTTQAPRTFIAVAAGCVAVGKMARKLRKKEGREIYARRKTIVEPVFGQTKEARGLRRFLLRGLAKVNGEWMLWGTTHNLNKLWRHLKK